MDPRALFVLAFLQFSPLTPTTAHPHPPCDSSAISGGAEIVVAFSPGDFILVVEGATSSVNATISGIEGNITIVTWADDPGAFETLFNETEVIDPEDGNVTVVIPVRGRRLSTDKLLINITHAYEIADDQALADDAAYSGSGGGSEKDAAVRRHVETTQYNYDIKVSRKRGLMEIIFTYSLMGWLVISYVTMGSKMDLGVIWTKLRKPYGVLTGIACQFILMPLVAFALANTGGLTPEAAIGLLIIGSCPGGWISNIFALLMDVDFVLSVTMTFCSSLMALGMMPLNMFIYGSGLPGAESGDARLKTPYKEIVMQLGLMLLPVGFGIYITRKNEKAARILLKCLKPMAIGLILISLCIGIPSQVYIFYASWQVYLICFALPFLGGSLGFVIAKLLRRTSKEALTISFETGVQNTLLATTVAKLSYPIPEADMIARMPFLVAILQLVEGTVMIVGYVVIRRVLIRIGKIARPDTGEYEHCDLEAQGDNSDNDDNSDETKKDEDRGLRKTNLNGDIDLNLETQEKNGYLPLKDDENVIEVEKASISDDVVSVNDFDTDIEERCKENNMTSEFDADKAEGEKEKDSLPHNNENANNNSELSEMEDAKEEEKIEEEEEEDGKAVDSAPLVASPERETTM